MKGIGILSKIEDSLLNDRLRESIFKAGIAIIYRYFSEYSEYHQNTLWVDGTSNSGYAQYSILVAKRKPSFNLAATSTSIALLYSKSDARKTDGLVVLYVYVYYIWWGCWNDLDASV